MSEIEHKLYMQSKQNINMLMQVDPELLGLYRAKIKLIEKDKRVEYIQSLLDSIIEDIQLANRYVESNNVDFMTAMEKIGKARESCNLCKQNNNHAL